MKIIKFHLPVHFADDIIRFGSMKNSDSGIGESHHITESKKPAQRTQRRFTTFEYQVANRQVENTAIRIAYEHLHPVKSTPPPDGLIENKSKSVAYFHNSPKHFYIRKRKQWFGSKWKDTTFKTQLTTICNSLVSNKHLKSPIQFFTYHKRDGEKFRANPRYQDGNPWYDWVNVEWKDDNDEVQILPAKMLLFISIAAEDFLKPFEFGSTHISELGDYAIAYSFDYDNGLKTFAHLGSKMCLWGNLMTEKD